MSSRRGLPARLGSHLVAVATVLVSTGCDDLATGFANADAFELFGAGASGAERRVWLVPRAGNIGGDPGLLGDLAGRIGGALYRFDDQASAYLFEGDLRAGISAGPALQLPRFDPEAAMVIDGRGERPWQEVTLAAGAWSSFRVYDSGECSVVLDWEDDLLVFPSFAGAVMDALDRNFARCDKHENLRFERVEDAEITPLFRARRGGSALEVDTDMIQVRTRYRALSIGGCSPVNLDVRFDLGFRSGGDGEIIGVVENVWSEVADFCIAESAIEDSVNQRLATRVPGALAAAVRDRFLLDPRDLLEAPDIPGCTNDADCATSWPWGAGHRCKAVGGRNECWIQIAVDRINLRPEGVELVLFEDDDDPQRALFRETPQGPTFEALLCGPERLGGVLSPDAVTTDLRSFTLSPDLTIDEICGE